ncbi:hypothetical protein PKOR_06145 [Pontibacter korlensis]|uniref:Uncharacterized protein n=1 Tax=Pontibacter korlensis TaxID=400092 RepID=A0A0E3ZFC4_9BACT|nr:hypothetical protein PKOR_06145 [Pontibacter korlensis]
MLTVRAGYPAVYFINMLSQLVVFLGYGVAGIMGGKLYFDLIVHVAPPWVVVHFFGYLPDFIHKGQRLLEVLKGKAALEFTVFFFPHKDLLILPILLADGLLQKQAGGVGV